MPPTTLPLSSTLLTIGYAPICPLIFQGAFSGALTGMEAGRYITDNKPADYAPTALDAVAWAQTVDRAVAAVTGGATTASQVQVDIIRDGSFGAWEGRAILGAANFVHEAAALAALMAEGGSLFVAAGGDPSPTPAGVSTGDPLPSILVYSPGATYSPPSSQPTNVFTDAVSLVAAIQSLASQVIVRIDTRFSPSGVATFPGTLGILDLAYGVTLEPANTRYDSGAFLAPDVYDVLELEPGVQLKGLRAVNGPLQIRGRCTLGPAILMAPLDALTITNGASLVLMAGSTSPLVQLPTSTSEPVTWCGLITDNHVALTSHTAGVPLFGLGSGTAAANLVAFSSRSLYFAGTVFGGVGEVLYHFDSTGIPLISGPARTVAPPTTVTNYWLSQLPQDELILATGVFPIKLVTPLLYGPVCNTWDEIMAWVNCVNNTVTDITVQIPGGTTATVTPTVPGSIYELQGVTLHGSDAPADGTLILGDGMILQDLAGITDNLDLQAEATTVTPFRFTNTGGSFFVDGDASLSFTPGASTNVPLMSITGPLSPFDLGVTDGGSIANPNNLVGAVALADAGTVVHVVATGGQSVSSAILGPATFSGLVFSGAAGQLYFAHDATVQPPLLSLYKGSFFDIRLSFAGNLAPATGGAAVLPSSGVAGDLFYVSDAGTLAVCLGAGKWASTNTTTGLSTALPASGFLGQLFYATDTGSLSVWSGSAWAPLGPIVGLSTAMPTTAPQGQLYVQTDTSLLSVYLGGKWLSTPLV